MTSNVGALYLSKMKNNPSLAPTSEAVTPQSILVLSTELVNFLQPLHRAAYPTASPIERHRAGRPGYRLPLAIWNGNRRPHCYELSTSDRLSRWGSGCFYFKYDYASLVDHLVESRSRAGGRRRARRPSQWSKTQVKRPRLHICATHHYENKFKKNNNNLVIFSKKKNWSIRKI